MKILSPRRGNLVSVALIDPKKKVGELGQYEMIKGGSQDLQIAAADGQSRGFEVRWYYKNLSTGLGECLPMQLIVTEIPPGHVQPFHTHRKLHEVNVVIEGTLTMIDSDTLHEDDLQEMRAQGALLGPGEMVIEEPGVRHTVANLEQGTRGVFYTIQVARIPVSQFAGDWYNDRTPMEAARHSKRQE